MGAGYTVSAALELDTDFASFDSKLTILRPLSIVGAFPIMLVASFMAGRSASITWKPDIPNVQCAISLASDAEAALSALHVRLRAISREHDSPYFARQSGSAVNHVCRKRL